MARHHKLTAAFVRDVGPPENGTKYHGDGLHGLALRVTENNTKQWIQRVRVKRRTGMSRAASLGLGSWPLVTLAQARKVAFENHRLARSGVDPSEPPAPPVPTVADAVEEVIRINAPSWGNRRTARDMRQRINSNAGTLLDMRVDEVTTVHALRTLTPIWQTKPEAARKLRQNLARVMDWAKANGHTTNENAFGSALGAVLPKRGNGTTHHRAVPYANVADAIETIRASKAGECTKLCLEFLVLTACRSGEVREATWDEIDFDNALWTIPAQRMKMSRDHRVPLSDRATAVLREADRLRDGTGLVFPSPRGKVLSDNTLSKLMRENGIDAVPHGFRSSFRDWAAEQTSTPHAVMEQALAHKVGSAVEQAYARSDLLERRRELMQQWADYLCGV